MKRIFTIAAFAAATILATSCAKEIEEEDIQKEGIIAHASLQPVEATEAIGEYSYNIVWEENDKIAVLDNTNNKASFKLKEGAGSTNGTFQQEGTDALTAPLAAYYPASVVADDKSLVWPATQADGKNITNVPMTAESQAATGDVNFAFKHLGSVLQLVLTATNGEIDVKQIDITADQGLSGAFTVDNGTAVISSTGTTITTGDVSSKNIKLTAAATNLNFAVPSGDFTNFKITITGADNKEYSLSADNLTLNRAMVNKVTFAVDAKSDALYELEVNGHTVMVKLANSVDPKTILIKAYVDGDNVIIKANSENGQHLKCTMSDGEFCTSQSKTSELIYTFNISDISKNDTATIGYANAVSITTSPANAGTIKVEGELYEGETVKLVPAPEYEYGIHCWKDNNDDVLSDVYDYTTRIPNDTQSITAVFTKNLLIDGEFTVNDSGKKVRFTRGNLYYDGASKIEQRQYDYNANDYTSSTGHVSHFMWCKSLADATKLTISDTGISTSDIFFTNQSGFTVSGFNGGDCFSMSREEWEYLLNGREASTLNGTANARYFKGCVRDENNRLILGIYLLPDTVTWPASVTGQPSGINDGRYTYAWQGAANTYSYNDAKRLQDAGLVFLPAAGYRQNGNKSINGAGGSGYYWTPVLKDIKTAYCLNFNVSDVLPSDYNYRYYAFPVRLVTKVTE